MKSFLQLFLFAILIIIFYFFYKSYFVENKNIEKSIVEKSLENPIINQEKIIEQKKNQEEKNLITNLSYKVDLANSGNYEIKSGSSEVIYENGSEIVIMKNVSAVFADNKNNRILITSDFARFNSSNYDTFFRENIKIKYENHIITSNKIDFNFIGNTILIYENVIYTGFKEQIITDNIKINLITKHVEFYMNNQNEKIKIISK
jgi:hypothetical protein